MIQEWKKNEAAILNKSKPDDGTYLFVFYLHVGVLCGRVVFTCLFFFHNLYSC